MRMKSGRFPCFAVVSALLLHGCELPATVNAGDSTVLAEPGTIAGDAICSPLGGGNSLGGSHGLKADLYYLDPNGVHYNDVAEYVSRGTKVSADLYFDQVNVPTRPFDDGFVTQAGSVLTTPQGNTLYEWFGLDFRTTLKLAAGDTPGRVQFGVLSDDGAVLLQQSGSSWSTVVDGDGTHASMFKGATQPITLDANSALKLRLEYYQGPRYHIAAMILWRPWTAAQDVNALDPVDGQSGNDLFFDSTQSPPSPRAAYTQLLARGWKVVPPANYYLPDETVVNPCPPATSTTDSATATATTTATSTATSTATATATNADLTLSGFDGTTTNSVANLIWTTNNSATGVVHWGTSAADLSNEVTEPTSGTTHQLQITGLTGATQYYFQAEATDGQTTVLSPVIHKTTK
jgi:hypothetical protein